MGIHGFNETSVTTQKIDFLVHAKCKMANEVHILSQQPWQKMEIHSISCNFCD